MIPPTKNIYIIENNVTHSEVYLLIKMECVHNPISPQDDMILFSKIIINMKATQGINIQGIPLTKKQSNSLTYCLHYSILKKLSTIYTRLDSLKQIL